MIDRLVINGCSYLWDYSGLDELADALQIQHRDSIALAGSCNSRIIRTTLQDSYSNASTLYVVGLTYLTRYELPIFHQSFENEGRWVSVTAQGTPNVEPLCETFPPQQLEKFNDLWNRATLYGLDDLFVDLQYRLLALIDSLKHRGHQVVIFNTAESVYDLLSKTSKLDLLYTTPNIVQGLDWRSIPWQFAQGAAWSDKEKNKPLHHRHVEPGQHKWLNEFLTNYIKQNKILE